MSRLPFGSGSNYPPGCSGPPECPEPSPESEAACEMLEAVGADEVEVKEIEAILTEHAMPEEAVSKIMLLIRGFGVSQDTIDAITSSLDDLAIKAANCCPACETRRCEAEDKAWQESEAAGKLYQEQEEARWAAMTAEERNAELDRIIDQDPTGR